MAALWEITLAALKLGAVLSPASTLLTAADLRDRIERGGMKHVIAERAAAERFGEVSGSYTRIAVGGELPGWISYERASDAPGAFEPDGPTNAGDPFLLYFTSGTTAKPKIVRHTQVSYPVGHLSTMYWIGLREGDLHFNISSPGWAKHAWSSFFAPWNAGAAVVRPRGGALRREEDPRRHRRAPRRDALRAADRLADARARGLEVPERARSARSSARGSRSTPR